MSDETKNNQPASDDVNDEKQSDAITSTAPSANSAEEKHPAQGSTSVKEEKAEIKEAASEPTAPADETPKELLVKEEVSETKNNSAAKPSIAEKELAPSQEAKPAAEVEIKAAPEKTDEKKVLPEAADKTSEKNAPVKAELKLAEQNAPVKDEDNTEEKSTPSPEDNKAETDKPAPVTSESTAEPVIAQEMKAISGDESQSVSQNERQKKVADKPVSPQNASILVVEDNVVNFRLFARLLGYMGVSEYEWKTSGWQVAEFAATMKRIDLILLDIRLPYEDGFEVIKKLRQVAALTDTLIVAVTAEASVKQMHRAQEEGFDGFIGKPIDPDRFPGQIKRILSGVPVWEIH